MADAIDNGSRGERCPYWVKGEGETTFYYGGQTLFCDNSSCQFNGGDKYSIELENPLVGVCSRSGYLGTEEKGLVPLTFNGKDLSNKVA